MERLRRSGGVTHIARRPGRRRSRDHGEVAQRPNRNRTCQRDYPQARFSRIWRQLFYVLRREQLCHLGIPEEGFRPGLYLPGSRCDAVVRKMRYRGVADGGCRRAPDDTPDVELCPGSCPGTGPSTAAGVGAYAAALFHVAGLIGVLAAGLIRRPFLRHPRIAAGPNHSPGRLLKAGNAAANCPREHTRTDDGRRSHLRHIRQSVRLGASDR